VQIKLSAKKRMRNIMFIAFLVLFLLIVRLAFIQILQGDKLRVMAYEQQTLERTINPKRGTIYDSTREVRPSRECYLRHGYS